MTTHLSTDVRPTEIVGHAVPSILGVWLFWWGFFLLLQQVERLFLIPEVLARVVPETGILARTLETGLRADLVVATLVIVLASIMTLILLIPWFITWILKRDLPLASLASRFLNLSGAAMGCLLLLFLVVDMGYYEYSHQRLDFVFVDYLFDLLDQTKESETQAVLATESRQAVEQTQAELGQVSTWAVRLSLFFALQGFAWFAWSRLHARLMTGRIVGWIRETRGRSAVFLCIISATSLSGFNTNGPWGIPQVNIPRSEYYSLSQSPIWCTLDVLYGVLEPKFKGVTGRVQAAMPYAEAIETARRVLRASGDHGGFPSQEFPFVREYPDVPASYGDTSRLNVVVLFIEGLDRRLLGRAVDLDADPTRRTTYLRAIGTTNGKAVVQETSATVAVSPFLDRLRNESVYFENFFSNGAQTHHGIFATLCSYYARYGRAAIKALYTYDYLCLPSVLSRFGYHTEMVLGNNRDSKQDHTALFMARNGLQELHDESSFPAEAERLGLGATDGALYDFLLDRLEKLQASERPFFLTTLTLSTHHPFTVPETHPDVRELQRFSDKYLAALRYADIELQRFLDSARKNNLLRNTVVFILGDHGRHEGFGTTALEVEVGHFMPPLFVLLDDSVRARWDARARTIQSVASQVDITPTILGLIGLHGPISPFVGKDLSCMLISDCAVDNFAFISRGPGGLIGLADREGLVIHYLGADTAVTTDLGASDEGTLYSVDAEEVETRYRALLSLFVSSNLSLEQNRVWSWRQFGPTLDKWRFVRRNFPND